LLFQVPVITRRFFAVSPKPSNWINGLAPLALFRLNFLRKKVSATDLFLGRVSPAGKYLYPNNPT